MHKCGLKEVYPRGRIGNDDILHRKFDCPAWFSGDPSSWLG